MLWLHVCRRMAAEEVAGSLELVQAIMGNMTIKDRIRTCLRVSQLWCSCVAQVTDSVHMDTTDPDNDVIITQLVRLTELTRLSLSGSSATGNDNIIHLDSTGLCELSLCNMYVPVEWEGLVPGRPSRVFMSGCTLVGDFPPSRTSSACLSRICRVVMAPCDCQVHCCPAA